MMMEYRFFKSFLVVAKHLNFAKAAHELRVTPAAVTRQIKLLEESLDTQLFLRSPKQVVLTRDGEDLLNRGHLFDEWINTRFFGEETKTVRLGAIEPLLVNFVPQLIKVTRRRADIRFEITHDSPSRLTKLLETGELDLSLHNKNIQTDLLSSRKLLPEKPVLISKHPVKITDISEHPWVTVEPRDYIINFAKHKKLKEPKNMIQINSPSNQVRLVEQGLGIAIVSNLLVHGNKKLSIQPVTHFKEEFIYAVSLNSKLIPKHVKTLLELVLESAKAVN